MKLKPRRENERIAIIMIRYENRRHRSVHEVYMDIYIYICTDTCIRAHTSKLIDRQTTIVNCSLTIERQTNSGR